MSLKHVKVVSTPDDGTSEVGSDEWNAPHTIDTGGLTFPANSSTPSTPADTITVFCRENANRTFPAYVNPTGVASSFQSLLARNKIACWNAGGSSATAPGIFGFPALSASGTATQIVPSSTSLASRMRRLGYPSAATAGSISGARQTQVHNSCGSGTQDGSGFYVVQRWVESDPAPVSGKRSFLGFTSSVAVPTNVEPSTLTNAIGIAQLSTDSTQWYWIQGGTTAQTAVAMGTGLGAPGGNSTTAWELSIYSPSTVANTYYLQMTNLTTGATLQTTMTGDVTQVPQSSTMLAWRHWGCNNTTAAVTSMDISTIYIESEY